MELELFETDGRLRRLHYLGYMFATGVASSIINIVAELMFSETTASIVSLLLSLPLIYIGWCASVRRAHDMGQGVGLVIIMYASLMLGFIITITGMAMTVMGVSAGASILGLGMILLTAYGVIGLILLVAGPDKHDRWGADPR